MTRDLIRDRTMAGLTAARARGRIGGRPPALTPDELAVARQMHASHKHNMEAIAEVVGVSTSVPTTTAASMSVAHPAQRTG